MQAFKLPRIVWGSCSALTTIYLSWKGKGYTLGGITPAGTPTLLKGIVPPGVGVGVEPAVPWGLPLPYPNVNKYGV